MGTYLTMTLNFTPANPDTTPMTILTDEELAEEIENLGLRIEKVEIDVPKKTVFCLNYDDSISYVGSQNIQILAHRIVFKYADLNVAAEGWVRSDGDDDTTHYLMSKDPQTLEAALVKYKRDQIAVLEKRIKEFNPENAKFKIPGGTMYDVRL